MYGLIFTVAHNIKFYQARFAWLSLISLSLYILSILANTSHASSNTDQYLHVYSWSTHISKKVLQPFEQETGISIKYHSYQTNDEMYRNIKARKIAYDLIFPSTYYISRMQKEGLLQPLDKSRLTQFKHLDPAFLNKPYDMGNKFSLPYLWGSTGIAVNAKKIDPSTITSWTDLWNPAWKNRLLLTNSFRQIFHLAFIVRGYSNNTKEPHQIKGAFNTLKKLKTNHPIFRSSLLRDAFLNGDVDIGMMWNAEVIIAQKENPDIHYIYPKEGAIFGMDSFAIPITNKNIDETYQLIDFMLRPQIAANTVEELGYATPNLSAKNLLDDDIRNNPIIFPPSRIIAKGEFQYDRGESTDKLLHDYWQKFKKDITQ